MWFKKKKSNSAAYVVLNFLWIAWLWRLVTTWNLEKKTAKWLTAKDSKQASMFARWCPIHHIARPGVTKCLPLSRKKNMSVRGYFVTGYLGMRQHLHTREKHIQHSACWACQQVQPSECLLVLPHYGRAPSLSVCAKSIKHIYLLQIWLDITTLARQSTKKPDFYFHIESPTNNGKNRLLQLLIQSECSFIPFHILWCEDSPKQGQRILAMTIWCSTVPHSQIPIGFVTHTSKNHHWARGIGAHPFASIIRWPGIRVYCALWLITYNLWVTYKQGLSMRLANKLQRRHGTSATTT